MSDDLVERVAEALKGHLLRREGMFLANSQLREVARAIIPIVREDEREACAKVAENFEMPAADDWRNEQTLIATAIRERNGG